MPVSRKKAEVAPKVTEEITKVPEVSKTEPVKPEAVAVVAKAEPVLAAAPVVSTATTQPVSQPALQTQQVQQTMRPSFQPRYSNYNRNNNQRMYNNSRPIVASEPVVTEEITGIFDQTNNDGRGMLRAGFRSSELDVQVSSMMTRQMRLRAGDMVTGLARKAKDNEAYGALMQITKVNGEEPSKMFDRVRFEKGIPIYPFEKIKMETGKEILSTRLIDMVAPIGRGQRGLIVSPPKAGKTTIIKEVASGIATNYPEVHKMKPIRKRLSLRKKQKKPAKKKEESL